MDRIKKITGYFRDAIKAKECDAIELKQQTRFWAIEPETYRQGILSPLITDEIFNLKHKKTSGGRGRRPESVEVILVPKTIRKVSDEEGFEIDRGFKALTGLFFIPAKLSDQGELSFHSNCKKLPWIPREFLHPMVEPQLCIGHSQAYNDYLDRTLGQVLAADNWIAYRQYAETLYEEITGSDFQADTLTVGETASEATQNAAGPQEIKNETHRKETIARTNRQEAEEKRTTAEAEKESVRRPSEKSDEASEQKRTLTVALHPDIYICLDPTVQASGAILNLYGELLDNPVPKPLYEKFLSGEPRLLQRVSNECPRKMKEHAGQMNGEYPLSPSQREALNHFLEMKDGEILAVSGPPGTGKTTLLQSVVADQVVRRALAQEKAPLIVATSTNNQAITNIIDSFGAIQTAGQPALEKRWICGVHSFAAYFPSVNKIQPATCKGYQCTSCQADHFAEEIDSEENIQQSAETMLAHCAHYFGKSFDRIADCRQALHAELTTIQQARIACLSLFEELARLTGGSSLQTYLNELDRAIREKEEAIRQAERAMVEAGRQAAADKERAKFWDAVYGALPWYIRAFSFIPSCQKKIYTRFRLEKNQEEAGFLAGDRSLDAIREQYSYRIEEQYRRIRQIKEEIPASRKALRLLEEKRAKAGSFQTAFRRQVGIFRKHNEDLLQEKEKTASKGKNPDGRQLPVWEKLLQRTDPTALNDWLDPTARYIEFWLAVHYFECRWIEKEDLPVGNQRGKSFDNILKSFYRRLALVAPCQVMTFYMLPKNFRAYNGNTKKTFHLYNEIDLLIVDEAGQATPEIAAPSFALARKAIVVGDESQLPPVWGIPRAVDIAIALQHGVIGRKEEFATLSESGLNCSESSVMKVAKQACPYRKEPVRGLFLCEHRRCYDEIIQFCNELVYKQHLLPLRGKGKEDASYPLRPLPHTGFLDIPTSVSTRAGLSRRNETEAREIARWVRINYPLLYAAYKEKDLKIKPDEVLAIITPFKAQVYTLAQQLKKELPAEVVRNITVGTVHTFQGGEKKVVILSTVYGHTESGYFIEQNPNLLNVAVSRAKDCFLIFGSRGCLKGPVGRLLKKHAEEEIGPEAFSQTTDI